MAILYGFISVFLMAAVPVINKFVVLSISPVEGALANSLIATVFFVLLNHFSSRRAGTKANSFCSSSMVAGVLNGIGLVCLFTALTQVHPAIIGLINRSGIAVAMGLSFIFLRLRPSRAELILGLVAILGAVGSAGLDVLSSHNLSLLLAFTSMTAFTSSQFFLKSATQSKSNVSILMQMNIWSTVLILTVFAFSSEHLQAPATAGGWIALVSASMLGSCLGFWFYLVSLKTLSLSMATILRATGPMFTAFIALPFFEFHFEAWQMASAIILMLSVIAMGLQQRAGQTPSTATAHGDSDPSKNR